MIPQIISTSPTFENCDPFKKYQKSTPSQYALQEIPILYGGGRKWISNCSNNQYLNSIIPEVEGDDEILVDIFVLNTSFIIWFVGFGKGLEISYLNIPAHAVRKDFAKRLELYIQLSISSNIGTEEIIEFSFRPKFLENERFVNDEIERLFTYEYFGLNKGEKMVFNTFNSISHCSCFHRDESESDEDQQEDLDAEVSDIYENGLDNTGNADDIDSTHVDHDHWNSASLVDIYDENGKLKYSRSRDELQEHLVKSTEESNKRIRC